MQTLAQSDKDLTLNGSDKGRIERRAIPTWFEYHFFWTQSRPGQWWIGIGLFCLLISTAISYATGQKAIPLLFVAFSLGVTLIPIATRVGYNILLDWEDRVVTFIQPHPEKNILTDGDKRSWYRERFIKGGKTRVPIVIGTIFIAFCLMTFLATDALRGFTWSARVVAVLFVITVGFLSGVVLYLLFLLGKLIWELGQFNVIVSRYSYGITSTGYVLLKIYGLASAVWFVISLSAFGGDSPWFLMLIIAGPTIVFLSILFIVIQFPLHDRMIEFKMKELQKLEKILKELTPENAGECTAERRDQVNFYLREEETINKLPEWPFRSASYLGVIGTSIAAIAPTVIGYLLQFGTLAFSK